MDPADAIQLTEIMISIFMGENLDKYASTIVALQQKYNDKRPLVSTPGSFFQMFGSRFTVKQLIDYSKKSVPAYNVTTPPPPRTSFVNNKPYTVYLVGPDPIFVLENDAFSNFTLKPGAVKKVKVRLGQEFIFVDNVRNPKVRSRITIMKKNLSPPGNRIIV